MPAFFPVKKKQQSLSMFLLTQPYIGLSLTNLWFTIISRRYHWKIFRLILVLTDKPDLNSPFNWSTFNLQPSSQTFKDELKLTVDEDHLAQDHNMDTATLKLFLMDYGLSGSQSWRDRSDSWRVSMQDLIYKVRLKQHSTRSLTTYVVNRAVGAAILLS